MTTPPVTAAAPMAAAAPIAAAAPMAVPAAAAQTGTFDPFGGAFAPFTDDPFK
jgi:hypothetical protein